jgi:anti-anti-sigma regulatory factor
MLRITESIENGKTIRLRLDGTITPETFAELDRACVPHRQDDQRTIILDMGGVSFMNADSAQKLLQLSGKSLRIINCSPFIATLLDTARTSE